MDSFIKLDDFLDTDNIVYKHTDDDSTLDDSSLATDSNFSEIFVRRVTYSMKV